MLLPPAGGCPVLFSPFNDAMVLAEVTTAPDREIPQVP